MSGLLALNAEAQAPSGRFNRMRTFDVQHYKISISFNEAQKSISATTIITLKPLTDGLSGFSLDAEGLDFTDVRLAESGTALPYTTASGMIRISLPRAYAGGESISVRLTYSAKPRKGIYFVDALRSGVTIVRSAQIWTQGEPEESRHWFPSYDFPDDKVTSEQEITVRDGVTVVANGELKAVRTNSDGTRTYHYRMDLPHPSYLVSFVVGNFAKSEDSYRGIPLGFYLYPNRLDAGRAVFAKTKEMMRVYEELTGTAYPFNKYDQTIVSDFNFGGMENITATTLSDRDVFLADSPLGREAVEDLVSHELAHSWFGNLVTCKNWAELWLNEGFATFMEAAWRERAYGRDKYLAKIRADADEFMFNDERDSKKHGLYNLLAKPDDSIFDTTTYKKGGAVVHMLRDTVGNENFWSGIQRYLDRHRFGNVETSDLQKAMEEVSGKDLRTFFGQWVHGTDYPKLDVSSSYRRSTGILTVRVAQTQVQRPLTPNAFEFPLELSVETKEGTKAVWIRVAKRVETAEFRIPGPPVGIGVDPDLRVPLKRVTLRQTRIL